MNKFGNWIFGIKTESKEEQEKRIAEINSTLNELQDIDNELKLKESQLSALNKYIETQT